MVWEIRDMVEFENNKYAKRLSIGDVIEFENSNKIKLPKDYIDILLNHHGSRVFPSDFSIHIDGEKEEYSIDAFLELHKDDGEFGSIIDYMEILREDNGLPERVIPFGIDAGGNLVCLDYQDSEIDPKIVFWKHDENRGFDYISVSFYEFMNNLY